MALVVEDNTGLATAESYVDLAAFKAYCAARGKDLTGKADADLEIALRAGFGYINANWIYKSTPKSNDQAGEFPRVDLSDGTGRIFNTVPQRAKDAQCEAAFLALTTALFVVAERGGQIVSESVGPISTTYAAGAPAETLFGAVEALLKPFVRYASMPTGAMVDYTDYTDCVGNPADPVFSVGMDDNTGGHG